MRRTLALLALALCLSGASALAADAPPVQLPRDHYAHPGSGIEWWYFTALVRDNAGTRYSVFFTLFASKGFMVPVAQVVNLDTGKLVGHSETLAPGAPGAAAIAVDANGVRLAYSPKTNTWTFSVANAGLHVSLGQRPEKPYVLHGGGTGVIQQSVAGVSHYYSATRMRATGTLRAGGKTVAVTGESWFDHQWGDYADNPRAFNWDWFSCRFDDGTELMGYQFLDPKTKAPLPALANGTFVAANGHASPVRGFEATPAARRSRRRAIRGRSAGGCTCRRRSSPRPCRRSLPTSSSATASSRRSGRGPPWRRARTAAPASSRSRTGRRSRRAGQRLGGDEDGKREAVAHARDQVAGQPVRALGLAREHDLVGREDPQRIADREQRIGVADAALRMDAAEPQALDGRGEPLGRPAAGGALVRDPAPEPRVERRSDDEHRRIAGVRGNRAVGRPARSRAPCAGRRSMPEPRAPTGG